jgi:succinate dehydrogenase / fumarate reductase cytochrome b subunit
MLWAKIYATYHRFSGSWAFLGHRLTGIMLTVYIFVHVMTLRGLQQKLPVGVAPEQHPWMEIVKPYTTPFWLTIEWAFFSVVLFHALNGVRIALVDLGHGSTYHKPLLWATIVLGLLMFIGMGAIILHHATGA